jgi:threonine/homoserine/homoserine lactone efflux protein
MTGEALALVLLPALGIALSPFAIVPAILVLFAPRPAAAGGAFLAGWFAAVLLIAGAASLASDRVSAGAGGPEWAGPARVVLGLLLIGLGARMWLRRHLATEPPAMLAALQSAAPATALRLGATLALVNPKVLLMAASAGLAIGTTAARPAEAAALLLLFAALASLTVALPWLAVMLAGERARSMLARLEAWLDRNNAALTAAVLGILGALLLAKGFG